MNKDEKEICEIIGTSNDPHKTAIYLLTVILMIAQQS
jgi:hypothetical protein